MAATKNRRSNIEDETFRSMEEDLDNVQNMGGDQSLRSEFRMGDESGMSELREQAATVGHDIQQLASTAGQVAMHQVDPIQEYVREKPLQSMLIAAGVGAVLGMVLFRR